MVQEFTRVIRQTGLGNNNVGNTQVLPETAEMEMGGAAVRVVWPGGVEASFPVKWLLERNISKEEFRKRRYDFHRLPPTKPWGDNCDNVKVFTI